ncbi:GNAT family N-acetyltransferase [Paeniglutamicibacter cryotolerans]|uniref:Ribosomal protein S18 acetylase RimI-like enzyme n=1 Tax=Paeniglutamicibacter cryotolerans TaxID=670079 RepID=A0A839QEI3_9MICC|nr:GNAT family N-acetyltransferase [Paeniglutamicibacter cryotolerans]MBB2994013.1 ribosomal protein S18 acetylase RimI-like enzyme [Paeniglutamicibacter cryotolerans]
MGWSAHTRDPNTLFAALTGSSAVAAALAEGELIGLARVVSDGASICYLQDVLVHPEHRRTGLGARLACLLFGRYPRVRQKVLLTDGEPGQAAFHASLGFSLVGGDDSPALRSFVRSD